MRLAGWPNHNDKIKTFDDFTSHNLRVFVVCPAGKAVPYSIQIPVMIWNIIPYDRNLAVTRVVRFP